MQFGSVFIKSITYIASAKFSLVQKDNISGNKSFIRTFSCKLLPANSVGCRAEIYNNFKIDNLVTHASWNYVH